MQVSYDDHRPEMGDWWKVIKSDQLEAVAEQQLQKANFTPESFAAAAESGPGLLVRTQEQHGKTGNGAPPH